jgi:hypothetical protein
LTRRPLIGAAASAALCLAIAGCGGTASPTPAASSAAVVPSAQASVGAPSAAPSVEQPVSPSAAAPSAAPSTGTGPSGAPASGSADSEALKAQLPDTICGAPATKQALNADQLGTIGGSDMVRALAALGKLSENLALAVAVAPDGDCTLGLLQIKGIDTTLLESAMSIAAAQSGTTATQTTVGGKDAWKSTSGDKTTYVAFGGEHVIFATATDDADARSMIESLP